jgi:dihydroflavonol-4-reductase
MAQTPDTATDRGTAVVTGASGFIAKHVIAALLQAGWTVRGTLRDAAGAAGVRAAMPPSVADSLVPDRLTFAQADLSRDDGWDAAVAGADVLIHMASPFPLVQPKNPDALIRPAVDGTVRALGAAARGGIRRVVMTSSSAAVTGRARRTDGAAFDEADWTDPTGPLATPYAASKTLAERAAWEFAARNDLELTVINPSLVLGPALDRQIGTSLKVVQRLLQHRDPMVPDMSFSIVDVREVALMHLRAAERPETAGRRLIGAAGEMSFRDMALALAAAHPGRRFATRVAPKPLLRLLALFDPSIRTILPSVGRREPLSAEAARTALGIDFRPARVALLDAAAFLLANGLDRR